MFFKRDKVEKSDFEKSNNEIAGLTYFFVLLFVGVIIYLTYFTYFLSNDVINNSYNPRQDIYAKKIVRGDILDRNNNVLATTVVSEDMTEKRYYPYGNMFAHAVGFSEHGKSGVEAQANFTLLTSDSPIITRVSNDLNGIKNQGDKVKTTLDYDLQKAAFDSLGNNKGAVIVTNCKTGEILCMVSKPDFDPNTIAFNWDIINSDSENSILLNRTTQGLYPPGSTFKIVTALEYLIENDNNIDNYDFVCSGSFSYLGNTINCYHGQKHGEVDLNKSFAKSCNSSFANISTGLDRSSFSNTCNDLLFGKELPTKIGCSKTFVPINSDSTNDEVMQTAIGQGKTQITPIHMNMITSAIANNGILMKPYMLSEVINSENETIKKYKPDEYGVLIDEKYAFVLRQFMKEVVDDGTATRLKNDKYDAAGKTGSAEFSSNKKLSHAWFTGFAPYNDPQIAITVIAENAGSGGEIAVPIARAVFDAYFK